MTDERFHELLEGYSDGTIGEAGSSELLEAFSKDPGLKARFVSELQLVNSLHGLQSLESGGSLVDNVLGSIRLGKGSPDVSEAVIKELRGGGGKVLKFPSFRVWAAVAAVVAMVFALVMLRPPAEALAVLANTTDARWGQGQEFREKETLGVGMLHLDSGVIRLDFETGVRVTLEGPAQLELLTPTAVRLHYGDLAASVPPAGIGFQVLTDKVDVTDLGTTFGVSVAQDGSTDVEVFEGKVEIAPPPGDVEGAVQREIIHEGDAVNVPAGTAKAERRPIQSRSFRGWPVLFGVLNTGGHIRFVNAQPVRNPSEVKDNESVIVFPERFDARPKKKLLANFTKPGRYRLPEHSGRSEEVDLSGRLVNSYLLQFNPPFEKDVGDDRQTPFVGEVTFDRPVIAIIASHGQLQQSDPILGKRRFSYPDNPMRGLEHGDSLTLSPDRRSLAIHWVVMQSLKNGMDQIRVIVDASPPSGNSEP